MDFAIRASDGKKVFAKDCKDTKESPYGFYCLYCKSEMMLKSYKSSNYKTAYFAARYKESSHTDACKIQNTENSEKKGGIDTSLPLPYKSKLVIANNNRPKNDSKPHASLSIHQDEKPASKQNHNNTATHLASIVDYYLQDPHLLGNSYLQVPGCNYRKYKSVFQRIYMFSEKNYKGTHIFFGSLFFKTPFEEREEDIIFKLYQNENAEPIEVFLHTKGWKDSEKHVAKNFVREAIKTNKDAYKNRNGNISPCIFFLGSVDENSKRIFHCYEHAAFYAIAVSRDDLNFLTKDTSNYGIFYPNRENFVSSEKVFEQTSYTEENETVSSDFLEDGLDEVLQNIERQLQSDQADGINILLIEDSEKIAEEVGFSEEAKAKNYVLDRDRINKVSTPQKAETKPQSNENRSLSVEGTDKSLKKKSWREKIESSKTFKEGVKLFKSIFNK